jgi:CRP-like cAMP-binding protein
MGLLMEVDLDEFLELMECETEARLRVAEIMERRRRAKKAAADLGRSDDSTGSH